MSGSGAKVELDRLIEDGLARYGKGDLDGALLVWEQALSIDPDNEQANSYVDYVRMHYELLTGGDGADTQDHDAGGYGIGADDEPEYQIEIVPGQIQPVAPPPLYMDPLDEGWFLEEDVGRRGVVSGEVQVPPPVEITMEADEPDEGPGFDDATREYPPTARRHAVTTGEFQTHGEFQTRGDEVTPGFAAEGTGFNTQVTDIRKRDLGFVKSTSPDVRAKRKSGQPSERMSGQPSERMSGQPSERMSGQPSERAKRASAETEADRPSALAVSAGSAFATVESTEDRGEPTLIRPRKASVPPELKMTLRTPITRPDVRPDVMPESTPRIQPETGAWPASEASQAEANALPARSTVSTGSAEPAVSPDRAATEAEAAHGGSIGARAATAPSTSMSSPRVATPVAMTPQLAAALADVMAGVDLGEPATPLVPLIAPPAVVAPAAARAASAPITMAPPMASASASAAVSATAADLEMLTLDPPVPVEPPSAPVAATAPDAPMPDAAPVPFDELEPDADVQLANDAAVDGPELPSMPAPTIDLAGYSFGGDTVSNALAAHAAHTSDDELELAAAGAGLVSPSSPTRELSRSELPPQHDDLDLRQAMRELVSPSARTRDLELVTTTRLPTTRARSPQADDPMISAPTRDLGMRPPGTRAATEDEPTGSRSPIDAVDDDPIIPPPDGTRADLVSPFDPIDVRSAQILEDVDEDAPADEPREDRTRRRITALLDRAAEWNRHGEHDRAVAAVDLALSEDATSALAQKLIHRNREAIMTAFQHYLGDLERQPVLTRPLHELSSAPISPRAAFLLSRIDGTVTLDEILDVSGMPRLEAYRYLCQLFLRGVLR